MLLSIFSFSCVVWCEPPLFLFCEPFVLTF
jgi:hypothetical protein